MVSANIINSLDEENDVQSINPAWFSPSQIVHDTYVPSLHVIQLGKLDLTPSYTNNGNATTTTTTTTSSSNHSNTANDEMLIVEKHILHPYFRPTSQGDKPPYPDIAILKLYGSSLKVHRYARLDNPQIATDWTSTTITHQQQSSIQQQNYTFTTMGYGLDESNDTSNILKQTTLNYVPNPTCQALGLWDLVNQDMICASGDGVRDSCNGDINLLPLVLRKAIGLILTLTVLLRLRYCLEQFELCNLLSPKIQH